MATLKEQAPGILLTAAVVGGLLVGYAYYMNAKVLPAQERAMAELRAAHAADLERNAAETRQEIAAVNQLLKDALAAGQGGLFATEAEARAAQDAETARLVEAIATRLHPHSPLPKTPEEAEQQQNAQIDKVSTRLADRIQPILGRIASDQNLTRESLDRYAADIASQVSEVLGGEMQRNEVLGRQVQVVQGLAGESLALSHELTALYLSSLKDQGVLNRLLMLPANIVRDAANFSLLNTDERRAKEAELTARLRALQTRLDAAGTEPIASPSGSDAGENKVVVEPVVTPPVRRSPTRPASEATPVGS